MYFVELTPFMILLIFVEQTAQRWSGLCATFCNRQVTIFFIYCCEELAKSEILIPYFYKFYIILLFKICSKSFKFKSIYAEQFFWWIHCPVYFHYLIIWREF